jgi:hypothetical protein
MQLSPDTVVVSSLPIKLKGNVSNNIDVIASNTTRNDNERLSRRRESNHVFSNEGREMQTFALGFQSHDHKKSFLARIDLPIMC